MVPLGASLSNMLISKWELCCQHHYCRQQERLPCYGGCQSHQRPMLVKNRHSAAATCFRTLKMGDSLMLYSSTLDSLFSSFHFLMLIINVQSRLANGVHCYWMACGQSFTAGHPSSKSQSTISYFAMDTSSYRGILIAPTPTL